MSATWLELVQRACDELGLDRPSTLASSTDLQARQLGALANRQGDALQKQHGWTMLQNEWIVNVIGPVITTGDSTLGSAVITNIPDTSGISAGTYYVNADIAPQAARVASVDSSTQITMTELATATSTGSTFTFSKDTYAIPTDFDRYIGRTFWDRTNHWELIGPQSPQFDQWQRSGVVTTGPRRRFRQIGHLYNVFRLWPPPQAQDAPATLVFEYISKDWVETSAGVYQSSFTADDDVCVFDDELMVKGIKWRFYQAKGFDYAALQAEHIDDVNRTIARDGGSAVLDMSRKKFPMFVSPANVPDSGFGNP